MTQSILEKHEALVLDMADMYLNNAALQLGIKYRDSLYRISPRLSDAQRSELKARYKVSGTEFAKVYEEFEKMEATEHMQRALAAFTASGGNVEIDPVYDEQRNRLDVGLQFTIKDRILDKIEGLSTLEHTILKANAILQVDAALSDRAPNSPPPF